MQKLYINVTNHCNAECPFCCMSSSPDKQTFMGFDTFYGICGEIIQPTIIQLEGGEPTTHPNLYLFLEYLATLANVSGIVIDTNALTLSEHIDKIVDIAMRNKKNITVKPSFNRYISSAFESKRGYAFADYLTNIISSCEFIPYVSFELNVRGYSEEELRFLKESLPEKIRSKANYHLFNAYGKLSDRSDLPPLQIKQVYDEWVCYASDGKDFGQDIVARAKYETTLK